ncbi:MAG: hypothetical protein WCJ30_04735 [Deltaproteobacteria bacterium]
MSALAVGLLVVCPVGTVDQVEGAHMAVLGATGVHVVAVRAVEPTAGHAVREGDRVELSAEGRCMVRPPDLALRLRIEARLRSLRP